MVPGGKGPTGVDFSAISDEQFDAISDRTEFLLEMDHAVDGRIKSCLAEAFGAPGADVEAMFQGVSALALDGEGNYILTNFMKAIYPLLEEANKIEAKEVDDLVGNRAARRAKNRRQAMHALGVPTTRSLAVVATGETVMREKSLPGAVLTRVAASHIRVGTFEYAAHFGSIEDVRKLADYTIGRHFSDIAAHEGKYLRLLQEVVKRQALLIAKWQLVGFIHGVMNTDNMAVSGETIDYGPCAFMDAYDPATVFSSIDTHGRYAYENQPKMAVWNLARLAEALLPLLPGVEAAQEAIEGFWALYRAHWLDRMRAKLGLFDHEDGDIELIDELLRIMQQTQADYTKPAVERVPVYEDGKPAYDGDKLRTVQQETIRYKAVPQRHAEPSKRNQHERKPPRRKQ